MEETSITIEPVALAGFRETITRDGDDRVERHFVILPFAARWVAGEPHLNEELSEARWVRPAELAGLSTTPGLAAIVAAAFERLEAGPLRDQPSFDRVTGFVSGPQGNRLVASHPGLPARTIGRMPRLTSTVWTLPARRRALKKPTTSAGCMLLLQVKMSIAA